MTSSQRVTAILLLLLAASTPINFSEAHELESMNYTDLGVNNSIDNASLSKNSTTTNCTDDRITATGNTTNCGNSTMVDEEDYYEGILAIHWTFATLQFLTACCCIYFLVAVLTNRNTRNQSYNLYLVFLVIPDCFNITSLAITNIFRAINGYNNEPWDVYYMDEWIYNFFYVANFYLNAVVAYEVYVMVHNSYNRRRTSPPSQNKVIIQATCVYTGAAMWATLSSSMLPVVTSWELHYAVLLPLISVPSLYVVYVRLCIRKLLPRSGRTKVLSLYFMRILIVFFIFYIPGLVFLAMKSLGNWSDGFDYSLSLIQQFLNVAQTLTTVYMAAQKDDINESIKASRATVSSLRTSATAWMKNSIPSSSHKRDSTDNSTSKTSEDVHALGNLQVHQQEEGEVKAEGTNQMTSIWEAEDVYASDDIEEGSVEQVGAEDYET